LVDSVFVFDEVFSVLSDGKYHSFEEISPKIRHLNQNQLEAVLSFLNRYSLITRKRRVWSTRTQGAKLTPEIFNFLNRVKELEKSEDPNPRPS